MASKPRETVKWRQDDIQDVKDALPGFAAFGSLSSPHRASLQISLGLGVPTDELPARTEAVETALQAAGVPVARSTLTAGYTGVPSPVIIQEVHMEASDAE
jgi:hypothetical protein